MLQQQQQLVWALCQPVDALPLDLDTVLEQPSDVIRNLVYY